MPDDKPAFNLDDIDFGQTIRGHQKDDRVFDRFGLKKLLGRGGMGVVWLALDERLGRDVALKFAPEAIRYDEIAVEELKEETRKGLDLAHPNIVKIYDFLLDEDYAAISMEFIDGENLGMLRTRQPNKIFEPRQITTWTSQLLDALDYAHRGAKVIHRDLKPANLMLDRSGNLRVTDFGIARSISEAMDRATLGKASTGTLAYMSPQQASGKTPHVSDDIYAVGSTLYELLTGKPPFHAGNIAQQLKDEAATPPTERRQQFNITGAEPIPPEWERTILACLEKLPENRPPSARAVMERLGLSEPARTAAAETPSGFTPAPGAAGYTSPPTNQTSAYVRPGAGLTEIAAPGRALTASRVQVGGAPANVSVTTPATGPVYTTTPPPLPMPRKKGHPVLWTLLFLFLMFVAVVGVAGWWGWDHGLKREYTRILALIQNVKRPVVPPDTKPPDANPPKPPLDDSGTHTLVTKTDDPPVNPPDDKPVKVDTPKPTTLQGMMNLAKAGDTVKVPEGIYQETLTFKEGVNLIADGLVIVQTDGKSGPALKVENCGSGSITGFIFQHSGDLMGGRDPNPVALIRLSSVKISGCEFKRSVGAGALVSGVGSSTFTNCKFHHNALSAVIVERGARPTLSQCEMRTSGGSGIEVRLTGSSPTLVGNNCSDNIGSGIVVKDEASATISGETQCINNKEAGIAVAGEFSEITVDSGVCENNTVGVIVKDKAKAHIKGVTVRKSTNIGISFNMPGADTEMSDCIVDNSATIGIALFGDRNCAATLTGNKITNSGTSGIVMQGPGFRPVLDHNTSSDNGNVGIYISEGCSGEIRNNTLRGNKNGGIAAVGAAPDLKKENNVIE